MSVTKKNTKNNSQLKIDFETVKGVNTQKKDVKVISMNYRDSIYKDILNRTMKS